MTKMDLQMQDTTVTCSQCGQVFTFSASEQVAYSRRGQGRPSLCAFCRAAHMIADGGLNTSGRNRSGGSSEGGGRSEHARHGDQGGRGEHVMYPAVCDQCGKQTRVPFEPHGSRPVYCSDCYQKQQKTSGGYVSGYSRSGSGSRR
jgi:CxxC-x17-CxxC domain-containing protein